MIVTSSVKCKIRQFQVEVMQKRQRNVLKSMIHVQSCCFAFDVLVAIASLDRKVPSLAGKRDSRRREKRKLYKVISRTRDCLRPQTYRSLTINGPVVISVALWANSVGSVFVI